MNEALLKIFQLVFDSSEIDSNFSQENNSSWNSIKHLKLILQIEMTFHINFEPEEIAELNSYQKIDSALTQKLGE